MSMGGGGHSTTTTTQELSPEQRKLMAGVIPIAQNYLASPPQMFPGSAIAGFNPLQQQAQQMTINAANAMVPSLNQIPGQYNALNQGYQNVGQGYGATGQGFQDVLKGYAGVDQFGQGAVNAAQGGQAGTAGVQNQVNQMIGNVSKGTNFLTSGDVLKASSNPYLQTAIRAATDPVAQQFRNQILPGLQNDAIGAGGFGGTRQGIASGLAGGQAATEMGNIAASMSNANYQSGLQAMLGGLQASAGQRQDVLAGGNLAQEAARQLAGAQLGAGGLGIEAQTGRQGALAGQQASLAGQQSALGGQGNLLQNAGSILSQMLMPSRAIEAVGTQQYAMEQAKLTEQANRFIQQQMIPFSAAQDVAAMAFGMPGGTTRSESSGGQGGMGMGGQAIGAGATVLAALLGKSDRRLKKDIQLIGEENGLNVYSFKYIGGEMEFTGFMADEVEELYPEMIVEDLTGYKSVKYGEMQWLAH